MSPGDTSLFMGAETPKKTAVVFNSDSDTDSIGTDSTAKSEYREEYEVERILMEVPDQEHCYLVKWEGYKLFRSTWEPPESLVGGEILAAWERQKKRIEAGEAEPFNYDDFVRAFEEAEREKKTKRLRRNAKRQKRGLPTRTYSSEESGDEAVEDGGVEDDGSADGPSVCTVAASTKRRASSEAPPRAKKRVQRPDVAKKGVAKKLPRRRVVSDTSSSGADGSDLDDQSSSTDSSQDELIAQASKPSRRPIEAVALRPETAPRKLSARSSPAPSTSTTAPKTSAVAPAKKPGTAIAAENITGTKVPHRAGPSGAAKKSALRHVTAAGAAKASHDVLANWDAPKQRRERQRVSEATPKDSTDPKFKALSVQGRYQKYGRENEKPPDYNALTVVDLASGRTIPPKASNSQSALAKALPSAYSRRTTPPQERRRSLTPPPPGRAPAVSQNITMRHADKFAKPICKNWLTKGCQKSARDCDFIHPLSKNEIHHFIEKKHCTCFYWLLTGSCAYGSRCHYAHAETGIYSPPPNSGGSCFSVNLPPVDASPPPPPPPPPQSSNAQQSRSNTAISLQPNAHHLGQPACRDWLEGHCKNPPGNCSWAHALPTEPYKGKLSNIPKHQTFCYWKSSKGACNRGTSCPFSHVDTGVQAAPPGSGESGRTNIISAKAVSAEPVRTNSTVSKAEAIARGLMQREITCFFWRTRGKCGKSDAECAYAHHHTGIWAAPPPGHSEAEVQRAVDNANMIPVATSRRGSFAPHTTAPDWSSNAADVDVSMELVGSPIQLQAPQMSPPGRENSLRRPSISTPAHSIVQTVSVFFSGDQSPTQVKVTLKLSELDIWSKLAGSEPHFTVDRAVLATDFKSIVWDDHLSDSEHTVGSIAVSDAAVGQSLINLCKQHTIGLIAHHPGKKARMLIYPSSDDAWKFVEAGSNWKSDSALRFRLFSEVHGLEDVLTSKPLEAESPLQRRAAAVLAGEQIAKLDSTRLLPAKDKWSKGDQAVFLMFPPSHHAELEFYANFFGTQKCHVYHSGVAGAWHFFLKSGHTKVVIVHPDIPVWRIPDLKRLLKANNAMFSVGLHRPESMDDEPAFGCERLFPSATAVLVTDEVFLYHPEKALEILTGFIDVVKIKPDSKLVTRPGIKEWLFQLAEVNLSAGNDNKHLRLYDAICRLCPLDDEDPNDPPNPHPDTNLVSLSPELFPNYNTLRQKDESAATQFLVEWFAGWTIENAGKLRKLHVLYEPKGGFGGALDSGGRWVSNEDPFGWEKKYQHIWFQKPTDVFKGGK